MFAKYLLIANKAKLNDNNLIFLPKINIDHHMPLINIADFMPSIKSTIIKMKSLQK